MKTGKNETVGSLGGAIGCSEKGLVQLPPLVVQRLV
jgi:hypothetical protein